MTPPPPLPRSRSLQGFHNQLLRNQGGGSFGAPVNLPVRETATHSWPHSRVASGSKSAAAPAPQEPPDKADCAASDCTVTNAVACADLNADGQADAVFANYGEPNLMLANTGGEFSGPVPLPGQLTGWATDVALASI